jgi:putative peptidoglycan lipid II flippase
MAISTAVFPSLAALVADEDHESLQATVSRALRVIMFLTIPSAIGLALLAEPVTRVLLERGEFTATDTVITASALVFYCAGIVPQAGIEIHSRGFYAMGDTRTPVVFAVVAVAANLLLSTLLWASFDEEGLAFALSAAAWVEWILLYTFYVRRTGRSPATDLDAIARFSFAAAAMALVVAVGLLAMEWHTGFQALAVAAGGAIAGGAVYAAIARWLSIPELAEAIERIKGLRQHLRPESTAPPSPAKSG